MSTLSTPASRFPALAHATAAIAAQRELVPPPAPQRDQAPGEGWAPTAPGRAHSCQGPRLMARPLHSFYPDPGSIGAVRRPLRWISQT